MTTKGKARFRNGRPAHWWHDAVCYEIYVQSFNDSNGDGIGDLNGVREKLPYLKELGVECIWLSPIMESPFNDCGYDVSDYERINPDFGTMEDYESLLAEAHELGIKVIIDMVIGYTSSEHSWFQEAARSKDAPTRDYYVWGVGEDGGPPNNWFTSAAAESCWTYSEPTGEYYYHAFLDSQPNLNWQCEAMRQEVYKSIRFWLDKGTDGFRMDAINYLIADPERRNNPREKFEQVHICDRDHKNIHQVLRDIRAVTDEYEDVMMVGEVFPGHTMEGKDFYGIHDELHLCFNFSMSTMPGNTRWYDGEFVGESLDAGEGAHSGFTPRNLRRFLKEYDLVYSALDIWPTVVFGNHDQPRVGTVYPEAMGEGYRDRILKLIAGINCTFKGTPFLYNGEELGMTNMTFTDIRQQKDLFGVAFYKYAIRELGVSEQKALELTQSCSRDKCRTPMQWSSQENAGFSTNAQTWLPVNPNHVQINAERLMQDEDSLWHFYRKLIRLRRDHETLKYGDYLWIDEGSESFVGFIRQGDEDILLLYNLTDKPVDVSLSFEHHGISPVSGAVLLSNARESGGSVKDRLTLHPFEFIAVNRV